MGDLTDGVLRSGPVFLARVAGPAEHTQQHTLNHLESQEMQSIKNHINPTVLRFALSLVSIVVLVLGGSASAHWD